MKIMVFLIIIAIIYFIALQIKVVHIDTLPDKHRDKLKSRSKIRRMLLVNKLVPCKYDSQSQENIQQENIQQENFQQIGGYTDRYELPVRVKLDVDNEDTQKLCYKKDSQQTDRLWIKSLPDATNLIELIKNEFMDLGYRFNVANLPVTTRQSNTSTLKLDKKYLKHVRNNIESWNDIFDSYCKGDKKIITIKGIRPIFVMETDHEFIIKVLVKIFYQDRSMHLELTYYGEMDRKDDFDNWGCDSYIIQLVTIRPIVKTEYDQIVGDRNVQESEHSGPFMSMKDQMAYVDHVNKMHREEIYNF